MKNTVCKRKEIDLIMIRLITPLIRLGTWFARVRGHCKYLLNRQVENIGNMFLDTVSGCLAFDYPADKRWMDATFICDLKLGDACPFKGMLDLERGHGAHL